MGGVVPAAVKRIFEALPAETPLWSVVVGLVVSLSAGIFFGLYPAVKASRSIRLKLCDTNKLIAFGC